jgi:phage replication-related protein YjqB (UPF0714/DUF867 family)
VFEKLLAEPGVEEIVELRSSIGLLAFHGGSLERMTDVVAVDAAERAGASVYAVVQPPGLRWHVKSIDVTPDASDCLRRFIEHVDVAIAVHGFGRDGMWTSLLLGGSNRELADHLAAHLAPALPDYEIVHDLDAIPVELRGLHPRNPVNLPRRGGVQLELPPRVRGTTPHWADWSGPGHPPPTEALVAALAAAVQAWPR